MKAKVFIDGSEGTTGLRIDERFQGRDDVEILKIDAEKRKDPQERKKLINAADIAFLCLPDAAARESVSLVENDNVCIIDTSTAHRTEIGWAYGFPELSGEHRGNIVKGKRIAVPGCHATGFISLVYPLISEGILPKDYPVVSFSLTGYSGAGKKAIAAYADKNRPREFSSAREYALSQQHKHLKEMQKITGLVRTMRLRQVGSCQAMDWPAGTGLRYMLPEMRNGWFYPHSSIIWEKVRPALQSSA